MPGRNPGSFSGTVGEYDSPQDFVTGLRIAFVNTEDISIGSGRCRDSTNAIDIVNGGTVTVQIDASGANGLDTGSEASDTFYAVHLIGSRTGHATAGLLSTSATSPTLPAGYHHFRRVGWVRNNGSDNLLSFIQTGDGRRRIVDYNEAKNTVLILVSGGTATTWTDVVGTSLIPSTSENAQFYLLSNAWAAGWTKIRGNALAGAIDGQDLVRAEAAPEGNLSWLRCQAQKIQYLQTNATNTMYVYMIAYEDTL
jgi:hypothetical protein